MAELINNSKTSDENSLFSIMRLLVMHDEAKRKREFNGIFGLVDRSLLFCSMNDSYLVSVDRLD